MKMLWKVKVLSGEGTDRSGWIAADNPIQAMRMAKKENAVLCGEPEEWEAGRDNQIFWNIH